MELYATKIDGVLVAADDESAEKMASLGLDTLLKCTAKKNRNYENHKRYFAFIKLAYEMQTHWTNIRMFRLWLQMSAGYFQSSVAPNGTTIFIPDSIAFEKIEEEDFKIFFKKVLDVYLEKLTDKRTVTDDEFLKLLDFM